MKINTDSKKIEELLCRGVAMAFDDADLKKKLKSGKQLRVKLGIDPTAADLHLGHAAVLRKLRQFQDLGHRAVLIIGDFTTLIGDPSGRTASRPALTRQQIRNNMKDYINQAAKVIDVDGAEIHYNSEWFGKEPMSFLMDLAGRFTVARLIEREDFQKRLKAGMDVSMLELLYPLLQGYDSVAVDADIELGGYDQCLNLLFGRKVQRAFGKPKQNVLMAPLLIGTDGEKKMSKSMGNYIGLNETPADMYSKTMKIADDSMWSYFELLTEILPAKIDQLKSYVKNGAVHPRDAKMKLAHKIVAIFHNKEAADFAQNEFVRVAQEGNLPSDIPLIEIKEKSLNIPELLFALGAAKSKGDARRLCEQGGVKIGGELKTDWQEMIGIKPEMVVQIGKNKFFKVK